MSQIDLHEMKFLIHETFLRSTQCIILPISQYMILLKAISFKSKYMTDIKAINIMEKFSLLEAQWTPHIIAELNGQYVKLCKLKDEFVWHSHEDEDELFMVFKGTLIMDFRDGRSVEINPGEILVVPKGVEHRPRSLEGEMVFNLLFEPKETKHTGEIESELTAKELNWI